MTRRERPSIYDVHAHLISSDAVRYPYAPLGGVVDESVLDDPMTAERLLAEMRATGVARAVAVQRAHVYGVDNSYVADAAAAYPDILSALVLVDALADDAVASVRHWVGERGAIGVRLTAPSQADSLDWLSSDKALTVWRAVADHGASMRVHFYGWNRAAGMTELLRIARQFPDLPVVLDHFSNAAASPAAPDHGVDDALKVVAECGNVSIMFSTINVVKSAAAQVPLDRMIAAMVGVFGSGRVMWGSDVGQSKASYAEMVRMARDAVALIPPTARDDVLWGTASRVYGGEPVGNRA